MLNIIWADFFGRSYQSNGIKTRLGLPVFALTSCKIPQNLTHLFFIKLENARTRFFSKKKMFLHFLKLHDTLTSCKKKQNISTSGSGEKLRTNRHSDKQTKVRGYFVRP